MFRVHNLLKLPIMFCSALDGIYFHPDHRLIDGLCSIIVQSVQEIHAGSWTCAARLVGRSSESTDDFVVRIDDGESALSNRSFAMDV